MGYIIISEEELDKRARLWNNESYLQKVKIDVFNAKVDYSHLLEVLQQAEKNIDEKIKEFEAKKNDIKKLMEYAE